MSSLQLPEGWSAPDVVEDIVVIADGLEIRRSGIAARGPHGEEVTGSAADTQQAPALRSRYELLERIAIIEALHEERTHYDLRDDRGAVAGKIDRAAAFPESDEPARWRYARSNGVALHRDFESAATRAKQELVERDRILRSWLGEITPKRCPLDVDGTALAATRDYCWEAYSFPAGDADLDDAASVVGVFGFPMSSDAPLAMGFAGRQTYAEACDSAMREALQQLAFLWGEPVPAETPQVGATAFHHLEHFQYHAHRGTLRAWLAGAHEKLAKPKPSRQLTDVMFIDLTPAWMQGFRVIKATAAQAVPLTFGLSPLTSHLPRELAVHPIA